MGSAKAQPTATVEVPSAPQAQPLVIADIVIREGRRDINDIDALAASIKEHGLMQPIAVDADNVLIWGARRLAAHKLLGLDTITGFMLTVDGIDHGLMEIDENLMRQELTVAERSLALLRRKELYEAKYPETVRGAAGGHGKARKAAGRVDATSTPSFKDATADQLGLDPKTVMDNVRIAEKVLSEPSVLDLLKEAGLDDNRDAQRALATGTKTTEEMIAEIEAHVSGEKKLTTHKTAPATNGNGKVSRKVTATDVVEPQPDPIAPHSYVASAIAAVMSLPVDYSITYASMQEFASAHPNFADLTEAAKRFSALAEFVNALGGNTN